MNSPLCPPLLFEILGSVGGGAVGLAKKDKGHQGTEMVSWFGSWA